MSVAAIAVGAVAVGAAAYSASAKSDAIGKAGEAQSRAAAEARVALNKGTATARADLEPYSVAGKSALNELMWQMGLDYQQPNTVTTPDTYQPGQTNDPIWEKILSDFNAQHTAWAGQPMNRPWTADADAQATYAKLSDEYQRQYAAANPDTPYVGQGESGQLMKAYDLEQYKKDPGYTPMVKSLEELQAEPGYQFQLEQGLQSVNNTAAAKGGLLSGNAIKATNDYAQGLASTSYQAAWDRAQQAYNNAFNRDTTNKNNTFNRLQSITNNGQSAAGQQGEYSFKNGALQAGISTDLGASQANLALAQGQVNANMANSIAGAVTSGISGYAGSGASSGGLSNWFGGSNTAATGLNTGQLSNAITPNFQSGRY